MADPPPDNRWIVIPQDQGEHCNDEAGDRLNRRSQSSATLYTTAGAPLEERLDKNGPHHVERPPGGYELTATNRRLLEQTASCQPPNTLASHGQQTVTALTIPEAYAEDQTETGGAAGADPKDSFGMNIDPGLLTHWSQVKLLRHRVLTLRMQSRDQNEFCARQRQHGRNLLGELMAELKTGLEKEAGSDAFRHAFELFEQIQDNERELSLPEVNENQLVNQLSSLEYHYGRGEERLFETLQRDVFGAVAELPDEPALPFAATASALAHDRSESIMHPLLQKYYDRVGDIGVWRDRLKDLERTHRKAANSRETRVNQGQAISPPDLDFYDEFRQKRESILKQIALAEAESKQLRRECQELSLEVSASESSAEGTEGELPSQSNDMPPKRTEARHQPQDAQISDMSLLSRGFSTARDRIDHWLGGVDPESVTRLSPDADATLPHAPTVRGAEFEDAPSNDQLSRDKLRSASISAADSSDTAATSPPASPVQDARSWRRPRTASSDSIIRPL